MTPATDEWTAVDQIGTGLTTTGLIEIDDFGMDGSTVTAIGGTATRGTATGGITTGGITTGGIATGGTIETGVSTTTIFDAFNALDSVGIVFGPSDNNF